MGGTALNFKQQRRLAMEIDLRLLDVWRALDGEDGMLDDDTREMWATILRLAYMSGYLDAHREHGATEGDLHRLIR